MSFSLTLTPKKGDRIFGKMSRHFDKCFSPSPNLKDSQALSSWIYYIKNKSWRTYYKGGHRSAYGEHIAFSSQGRKQKSEILSICFIQKYCHLGMRRWYQSDGRHGCKPYTVQKVQDRTSLIRLWVFELDEFKSSVPLRS